MIFLTGMPGAGKTYWGGILAARYDLKWVDTDAYIEKEQQCTIDYFFSHFGEAMFRNKESEALKEIIALNPWNTIVSCGGGTTIASDNRLLMRSAGCVIYLQTGVETLFMRLRKDENVRPLLAESNSLYAKLKDLSAHRESSYKEADYIVQTEHATIHHFEPIIRQCIKQH